MNREKEVLAKILEHVEIGMGKIEEGHSIETFMELCFLKGFVETEIEFLEERIKEQ